MIGQRLRDRDRVEIALIPSCFLRIVRQLIEADGSNAEFILRLGRTFADAVSGVLADVTTDRARVLHNRIHAAREAMLSEFHDRPIAVALVAVTLWARRLNEAGIVRINGGHFEEAAGELFEAVYAREGNAETIDAVTKSATKAAKRMHEGLIRRGYYLGFPNPFETEPQREAA